MRQETIVKTYLKFNELTAVQRGKVLDKLRNINVEDNHWHDYVTEEFTDKLKSLGYSNINCYFSGFWSQGDGACFTAVKDGVKITHSSRYFHCMTMQCDDPKILEESRLLAREYYKDLQNSYEYLTSDEAIIESIEANEFEFDQDTLTL